MCRIIYKLYCIYFYRNCVTIMQINYAWNKTDINFEKIFLIGKYQNNIPVKVEWIWLGLLSICDEERCQDCFFNRLDEYKSMKIFLFLAKKYTNIKRNFACKQIQLF